MRRLSFSIIGVIAAAAIAIGINMFADARLANVQLDLTQGHLYTLSPGTRQILAELKEPVTLRLFYSRQLGSPVPAYGSYADHVREMLGDYASLSHGKVRLEFYDPEPFSDTEDRAMAYGLQGLPLEQGTTQIYFGLAGTNLEDDERTIPFFQAERERFLEYDLTKLVYELSNPKRPVGRRDVVAAAGRRPAQHDDEPGTGPGRSALCVLGPAAADQHGEDGRDQCSGDRPRHPGAAGGGGAEPVAGNALCHRPVRHARRQADGHGRSVERGTGLHHHRRPECRRWTRIPT